MRSPSLLLQQRQGCERLCGVAALRVVSQKMAKMKKMEQEMEREIEEVQVREALLGMVARARA